MRIAQVLAFQESRPIDLREGRGRVVSYLAEELVREGHEVVLLAGAAPDTAAAAACDVVHLHLDRAAVPAAWRHFRPAVATLHAGRRGRHAASDSLGGVPLIAVSDAQRARLPSLPWSATIPYGIPADAFGLREGRGGYLAVVGAICPGEGIDRAIEIARRSGRRIRIASKCSETNESYFRAEVEPLLADPHVTLVGDLHAGCRNEFLGEATALLQLAGIRGNPELTAIEALASGTPVIRCGPFAAQETVAEGVADVAAGTLAEAIQAVERVSRLDRRRCRETFELRFTAARMASQYLAVYQSVVSTRAPGLRLPVWGASARTSSPDA